MSRFLAAVIVYFVVIIPFFKPAYADLQSGLVGCWSFENAGNIGADSGSYGHHGIVNGGTVTQIDGIEGQAACFSGTSEIEIAATSVLNPTGAISVSYWFRSTQAVPSSGCVSIVRHDLHFTGGQLRDKTNISSVGFDSTGSRFMISTTWNGIWNDGQWHHFVAAYGSSTYTIYIDGRRIAGNDALNSQQSTLKTSTTKWVFGGKESAGGEFYIGALDEVRVYNRLLSVSEIEELATAYKPHAPSPANNAEEQLTSGLTLSWNASLNESNLNEPDPDITGYYLYYRLEDSDFDGSGTMMVQVDADQNKDGNIDETITFGPLDFGASQIVYWKVYESINGSGPEDTKTIQGPVWSFMTRQTSNLQAGLVGYWTFEDINDIGRDSSGYSHDGAVNGSGITQISGIGGQAASFDGASEIEVAAASLLNPTDAITVSYWFKSTQPVPSSGCVSIVRHDQHFTGGQLRDTQNLSTVAFDSTGSRFMISTTWNNILNDGQWHHLAAVYGDGTYRMYIDGQLAAENNNLSDPQSTLQTGGANWVFGGKEGAGGEFYVGALDEIRVYNRRLSSLEVGNLMTRYFQPYNPVPIDTADEQAAAGLILSWNAGLDESDLSRPNPNITGYYLYYRLGDSNFDASGTTVVQVNADMDNDGNVDSIASFGPLTLGTDQTVYWKVYESIDGSGPEEAGTIQGPVWSFQTQQTKLVLLEQPAAVTAAVGDTVTFRVRYTSVTDPVCVWYTAAGWQVNGDNIAMDTTQDSVTGQYTSTLTFKGVLSNQEDSYYCILTNDYKTKESVHVKLDLNKGLLDRVDPTIGTSDSRWFYFSSACRPFGMVNLSPDTDTEGSWDSGYLYGKLNIRCFSHVHAWQLSGIPVLPTAGTFKGHLGMDYYQSAFTHDDEIVEPGYHRVHLDTYNITAELTSTTRAGFHRYTFPASDQSYVIFDVGAYLAHSDMETAYIRKVSDTEIEGYSVMAGTSRRPKKPYVYFVAEFNKAFNEFGVWQSGALVTPSPDSISGADTGGYVKFNTSQNEQILMKVGIAYTSIEQARRNMNAEITDWDFDQVVQDSQEQWNRWLGRIEVEGGTQARQIKFYTDLWHALLGRRIISDVDGQYCDMTGSSPVIRTAPLDADGVPVPHHNFDALWGAHWTINILWSMVYPELMDEFCNTMVSVYENGGTIPRGPSGGDYTHVMIGDPATSFFACAYNKGIRNYDVDKAYEGLYKNAFTGGLRDWASYDFSTSPIGGGMPYYTSLNYVPDDVGGSGTHRDGASMTLEYSYQDWCLGQLARAMGNMSDYRFFTNRSFNYRNLWDPSVNYIRPRSSEGTFVSSFSPLGTHDFCESTSAVYTNFVPHDMRGLISLFGGNTVYRDFLDSSFTSSEPSKFLGIGQRVDYSNQPGTQMAHLFNYCGAPWLSQKWVRKVKELTFGDITPYGGYNGDEDQGQMGALGVLMAIGLFELDGGCAVRPIYEITSPIFDRVVIHLDNKYYPGDTFEITTTNNSTENIYIQSALLNGQKWDQCWFPHSMFAAGGTLQLIMGSEPNTAWGSGQDNAPPSAPFNGDLNGDDIIDMEDIRILSLGWMTCYDMDSMYDLAYDWLEEMTWESE